MSDPRYVVIMAGGSGTRFWPASRAHHPKQFLPIGSDVSLIRQTADRVADVVGWDHLVVVIGALHVELARAALPELPERNILVEPVGRNTAPCIGWATKTIRARDPNARIAVLPADHHIADVPAFQAFVNAAFEAAVDRIVLFGIVPDRPETGYGYIQRSQSEAKVDGRAVHGVVRFVEKPNPATAEEYVKAGDYLWNSGMFVFSAAVMEEEIRAHLPELDAQLDRLAAEPDTIDALYPRMASISIDYGVMERTKRIAVMPAVFGWSDVGSWDAAMDIYAADADGNVTRGEVLVVGSKRTMVESQGGRLVAVVGVEDVIVVDSGDAVLVVRRGQSQDVKTVVETLKSRGQKGLL